MDAITYAMSKKYTDSKVSVSTGLHREIVNSLPVTGDNNTIYMVLDSSATGSDIYDEWLWTNGAYEHIGSTRVDLTDYYNKTQIDTALSGKANTSDIPTSLSSLSDDATHRLVTDTEKNTWNGKSNFSGSYNDLFDTPDLTLKADKTDIDSVYSVMGQNGAKNLIPYPYYNTSQTVSGITITDNGDGTLTFNGTASANATVFRYLNSDAAIEIPLERRKYKLTFGTDQGSSKFHLGNCRLVKTDSTKQTINVTGDTIIDNTNGDYLGIDSMIVYVAKNKALNNVTIYPMLRLASDTDDTYQPYAMTNRQLTEGKAELESVRDYVNELGVKNLIPYPLYETTKSVNGITFTDNGDGTITVNGTATATAQFELVSRINSNFYLPNGTYTVNGCPNTSGCQIRVGRTVSNADFQYGQDTGSGLTFTRIDATNAMGIALQIASGTTVSNLTFKPMLRLASDTDDTYQPYAMTNRQLTDALNNTYTKTEVDTALSGKAGVFSTYTFLNTSSFSIPSHDAYGFNMDISKSGRTAIAIMGILGVNGRMPTGLSIADFYISHPNPHNSTESRIMIDFYNGSNSTVSIREDGIEFTILYSEGLLGD